MLLPAKNKHLNYLLLTLATPLLFVLAWSPFNFVPFAFVFFIPLLVLEHQLRNTESSSRLWILVYAFLSFLLLNIGTTYWIWNASPGGAVAAWFIDAVMMLVPFYLYHIRRLKNSSTSEFWSLAAFWLAFELLHSRWELAFPWLTLGNVFAHWPMMVQWYEFTGVFGGSLWILLANFKLYQLFSNWKEREKKQNFSRAFNLGFTVFFAPLFLSIYLLPSSKNNANTSSIVIVQPNIDPYKDKFEGMSPTQQLERMLKLAEAKTDSLTQLLLFPETALQGGLIEENLSTEELVKRLKEFLSQHPTLSILTGADTYRFYHDEKSRSETSRQYEGNTWYDAYNTALFLTQYEEVGIYHKNKLVPGVENLPYINLLGFMKNAVIDLGGTSGGLGHDGEAHVFKSLQKTSYAPVICYESVFAGFVTEYVKKNADIICIITNDGWWGNTAGYKQHFEYARLRAIENRRCIARSANTGISGFIDASGNVLQRSDWWEEKTMKQELPIYTSITFYTRYGDWLAYVLSVLAFLKLPLVFQKTRKIY